MINSFALKHDLHNNVFDDYTDVYGRVMDCIDNQPEICAWQGANKSPVCTGFSEKPMCVIAYTTEKDKTIKYMLVTYDPLQDAFEVPELWLKALGDIEIVQFMQIERCSYDSH